MISAASMLLFRQPLLSAWFPEACEKQKIADFLNQKEGALGHSLSSTIQQYAFIERALSGC